MNNKEIIEFGFRWIWRIRQISEGVIHLSPQPQWITPSSICRIFRILLSLIQKLLIIPCSPNMATTGVCSKLKNKLKIGCFYTHTCWVWDDFSSKNLNSIKNTYKLRVRLLYITGLTKKCAIKKKRCQGRKFLFHFSQKFIALKKKQNRGVWRTVFYVYFDYIPLLAPRVEAPRVSKRRKRMKFRQIHLFNSFLLSWQELPSRQAVTTKPAGAVACICKSHHILLSSKYGHLYNTDTSLLRTVSLVPERPKITHSLPL